MEFAFRSNGRSVFAVAVVRTVAAARGDFIPASKRCKPLKFGFSLSATKFRSRGGDFRS